MQPKSNMEKKGKNSRQECGVEKLKGPWWTAACWLVCYGFLSLLTILPSHTCIGMHPPKLRRTSLKKITQGFVCRQCEASHLMLPFSQMTYLCQVCQNLTSEILGPQLCQQDHFAQHIHIVTVRILNQERSLI